MRNSKSQATAREWRELVELVDQFCKSISELKEQIGKLETKMSHPRAKRLSNPANLQDRAPVS